MRFQAPQLGALGVTFTALRLLQALSLIVIIGLVANFIDEITSAQLGVPEVMVGTIAVASIAVLYVIVSYILYYDSLLPLLIAVGSDFAMLIAFIVVAVTSGKNLNMLECSALPPPPSKQSSEPVTFTVSAPPSEQTSSVNSNINTSPSPITDGGAGGSGGYSTTSYGNPGDSSGSGGGNYGSSVVYNIGRVVARAAADSSSKKPTVDYLSFVARDQPHCYEIKTVWGLGIALCVLFAFSSIVCAGLWRRVKGPGSSAADKDLEG